MTNRIELDPQGFLADEYGWYEELARDLARELGLGEIDDRHIAMLELYRAHYFQHGAIAPPLLVCKSAGLGPHCVERLFGSQLTAWRLAGLPDPGEAARARMGDNTLLSEH